MLQSRNLILSRLSSEDAELLGPHVIDVDLPLRTLIIRPNHPIDRVIFLESGLGSEVAVDGEIDLIEVGLTGREGLIGVPIVLGSDRSPHRTFMQIAGSGKSVSAFALRAAMEASPTLQNALLKYVGGFMLQVAQTALANGRFKIEARLARWIMLTDERVDGDVLALTHEFLGLMLGVRRAGVSEALALLHEKGLIRSAHARITVLDRDGLRAIAAPIYA